MKVLHRFFFINPQSYRFQYSQVNAQKTSLIQKILPFKFKKQETESSVNNGPNYSQIVDQILEASGKNEDLKKTLVQLTLELKRVLTEAYNYRIINEVLTKVKTEHLCRAAVEQYVGSMSSPKNEAIKDKFLQYAKMNATSDQEKLLVQYYQLYLQKLEAVQTGNEKGFEQVNEGLIDLSNQGLPIAKHIVAKEMYKVALNMIQSKQRKQRQQMCSEALRIFNECAEHLFPHSFFYIGDLAEQGDFPGGINLQYALECYTIAASFDNPMAFFKLSKFYQAGVVVKKDPYLEYFYMKKAAELGLRDAMHNLAVFYREGKLVKKDDVKALAWFTHAGNLGFVPSMYNCYKFYLNGTEDKFLLPNKRAALVWLEKILKEGDGSFDVSKELNQLVSELENEAQKSHE